MTYSIAKNMWYSSNESQNYKKKIYFDSKVMLMVSLAIPMQEAFGIHWPKS